MQKLKEIVEGCIDGGWRKEIIPKNITPLIRQTLASYPAVKVTCLEDGREYELFRVNSISDLLSSHPAMKALLGEDKYCCVRGQLFDKTCLFHNTTTACEFCSRIPNGYSMPAYIYHIQQAFTHPTDKERVEYVYDKWKGEK
jgi:hypothetical protein